MNTIKRAALSLKSKPGRSIMSVIAFVFLFSVILCCVTIYGGAKKQIIKAENTIANAVTLKSCAITNGTEGMGGQALGVPAQVAQEFLNSQYLAGYNIEEPLNFVYIEEAEPFFKYRDTYEGMPSMKEFIKQGNVFGVADSERHRFFTSQGYEMVKGEAITPADGTNPHVLVTEEFAEYNGFDIGDEFKIYYEYLDVRLPVTITGIFRLPEAIYNLPEFDEGAHNYMFMPIEYIRQSLGEKFHMNKYTYITAYLKDKKYIDNFIAETKEKINIGLVTDHITKTTSGVTYDEDLVISLDEAKKVYKETGDFPYQLVLDRDWFELVAKPMGNVANITLLLTVSMVFGALMILIFMTIMSVNSRKHEMGILISMGESRSNIFLQIATEVFVPVIIALCISIPISSALTETFADYLLQQNAAETIDENIDMQNQIQADKEIGSISLMTAISRGTIYIEANTKMDVTITPNIIISYVISIVDVVLLLLSIQVMMILKLKPADILMGRR